jgi:molybdopterin converting factor small subunit
MARVIVRIPTPLRAYTGGAEQVTVQGNNVGEIVQALDHVYAGLTERILDANGQLRNFVNLFVGNHNIRNLNGLATVVADGDVLAIVPAVAGGQR